MRQRRRDLRGRGGKQTAARPQKVDRAAGRGNPAASLARRYVGRDVRPSDVAWASVQNEDDGVGRACFGALRLKVGGAVGVQDEREGGESEENGGDEAGHQRRGACRGLKQRPYRGAARYAALRQCVAKSRRQRRLKTSWMEMEALSQVLSYTPPPAPSQ